MKEFFSTYPAAAWSIVSIMVAGLVIMLIWEQLKWWWHNTWYSFPVIGKIASLSKDINKAQETGWFKSERTLCRDYKKFIRIQDEYDFNQKISYLTKAGDLGRKETPSWIWLLTIVMVFVESMGFAYVLAGFTIPGASENTQQYGAVGIAFLISVILVAFTHLAGHELFKSSQIRQARADRMEDGRKHKLTTQIIALAKPQDIDDEEPHYTQLANRVGSHPTYKITIATTIFVIVVAIFATYVRSTVLEQQLLMETTGKTTVMGISETDEANGLDLSAKPNFSELPADDVAEQLKAEKKAAEEGTSIQRHGGWGTFVVLAFVFVFLQILGVIFGFRWGFAGRESSSAFIAIGSGRYSTYSDVRAHYQEIADTAQAKLEALQQKIMYNDGVYGGSDSVHTTKTFRDFMEEERSNQTKERQLERQHTETRIQSESKSNRSPNSATIDELELTLERALAKIDGLESPDAKRDYVASLPLNLKGMVVAAIKERNAAAEKAKIDAELDNLFN